MPERSEFDAEVVGNEENSALMWTNTLKELDSCEDEKTAQTGAVDGLRLWQRRSAMTGLLLLVIIVFVSRRFHLTFRRGRVGNVRPAYTKHSTSSEWVRKVVLVKERHLGRKAMVGLASN